MSRSPRRAPRPFRYLTARQVEVICQYLIDRYFQDPASPSELRYVVYTDKLEAALAAPAHTFEGRDLFPTVFDKAACLFRSLVKDHPFLDGNKRLGHAALETFLILNGHEIAAPVEEQQRVILALAAGQLDRASFTAWLPAHVVPRARGQ